MFHTVQPSSHVPRVPVADPLANVRIPCFGDQLIRVWFAGAKDLRAVSHTAQDILDHLYPFRIVDWYAKRSILKVDKLLNCKIVFLLNILWETLVYFLNLPLVIALCG